jgi:tRNA (cytidine/uridine-2'-O-)-methyltransferase
MSLRRCACTTLCRIACRHSIPHTTKGSQHFYQLRYQPGDAFLFGPESRGLPTEVLSQFDAMQRVRLPMLPDNRSLNLSNAVAVAVFEAWRQCEFEGALTGS